MGQIVVAVKGNTQITSEYTDTFARQLKSLAPQMFGPHGCGSYASAGAIDAIKDGDTGQTCRVDKT